MPEGPELFLAARVLNEICKGVKFSGKVQKSEISKCPSICWDAEEYKISAKSRGKEVKLTLTEIANHEVTETQKKKYPEEKNLNIIFRYGLTGKFRFDGVDEIQKHAHLNFYTADRNNVLSFVDTMRYGSWEATDNWGRERGPCVITEYQQFRENVLNNVSRKTFDKPICEVLLNQKYFNGIGNYLRAEVLHRAGVKPFEAAKTVLLPLITFDETTTHHITNKMSHNDDKKTPGDTATYESPDVLHLCHLLPQEVINLSRDNKAGYYGNEDAPGFEQWLQCYFSPDMTSIRDHSGRTIWFTGHPGPLAPKVIKEVHKKKIGKTPSKVAVELTARTKNKPQKKAKKEPTKKTVEDSLDKSKPHKRTMTAKQDSTGKRTRSSRK